MDEIGEHAWIISIVGDFLTMFGVTGQPVQYCSPRASDRDCCRKMGQRAIEKRAFKTEQ